MTLRIANLSLLLLYPVAWVAPLLHAQVLPFFGGRDISVISGLRTLWAEDVFLAIVVAIFALAAPILKTLGIALIQAGRLPRRLVPATTLMGRLAMADIFLVALYIVLAKGAGVGRLEVGWGLYLFTGCVLASLIISQLEAKH
ncbi:Paraquat-inducible protein A [Rhodobacteraceae bacterium EhC02]|nr:paraquat-inducible protein A [Paracoccaceae bacterium]OAN67968.1 Paraquat-inducible protein A [Rhodobacteraceae bacterium EhC02]